MPDGDSQILILNVFGPTGLKDYGSASYAAKFAIWQHWTGEEGNFEEGKWQIRQNIRQRGGD